METGANISACGQYRYFLWRKWGEMRAGCPPVVFVMLNPSTADETQDDPTIRRCVGFAKREMAQAVFVMNLFAFRSTDPKQLAVCADPVGPENDAEMSRLLKDGHATVICAWGAAPVAKERAKQFLDLMAGRQMYCLGTTKSGAPRHPLYVPADQPLVPFPAPAKE